MRDMINQIVSNEYKKNNIKKQKPEIQSNSEIKVSKLSKSSDSWRQNIKN